jgi:hypothetical protein
MCGKEEATAGEETVMLALARGRGEPQENDSGLSSIADAQQSAILRAQEETSLGDCQSVPSRRRKLDFLHDITMVR